MIINITSSANRLILWCVAPTWKPVIEGSDLTCSASGSMTKLNMSGDSGQPCRVPLEIENGLESISDVYTCAEGEEYKANMADRICPRKPNLRRVALI